MIKQNIQADQITAMKAKDAQTLEILRYILAQIKNIEIDKKAELTEEEVTQVMRKELKKLQDSYEAFSTGDRPELAAHTKFQIDVMGKYMPQELSDEDLKKEIEAIIAANQEVFTANPNALIGICVGKLSSKANPSRISAMVRSMQ
ncbi:MAG: GatB/YqeY domain-containing protein [Weeksellaceae bacterium]